MLSLQGKVVIVTGSSRSIGRGTAERLGRDGASIVVTLLVSDDAHWITGQSI